MEAVAIRAEIALLGAPLPDLEDVGEGGFRATCMLCDGWWDTGLAVLDPPPWRVTDYEIEALQAYVQHVRDEHLEVS
jgi:hypothetical protein